jgi:hypothetical protein
MRRSRPTPPPGLQAVPSVTTRIANAASFPNECHRSAAQTVQAIELDYLTFSYASDSLLSELAVQRRADRPVGFVTQLIEALENLCPLIYVQPQLKVLAAAGGFDGRGCVEQAAELLCDRGCPTLPVAQVRGADVLNQLEEFLLAGCTLDEQATGEPFRDLKVPPVYAHAWLGADAVVSALAQDARLVVTDSLQPSSLTVAAGIHEFGWSNDAWDQLATAAAAGNCFFSDSKTCLGLELTQDSQGRFATHPGSPIVELETGGELRIVKPAPSDGQLTSTNVLQDIQRPLTSPDVKIDATRATAKRVPHNDNVVQISGIVGHRPVEDLAITIGLRDGYQATGVISIDCSDPLSVALELAELMDRRLKQENGPSVELTCEPLLNSFRDHNHHIFQIHGWSLQPSAVDRLCREIVSMRHTFAAGLPLLRSVIPHTQPKIRPWLTSVPKELVEVAVDCRQADQWL